FLTRCASCHGEGGRGDGPIAKGLAGPPVGDLTDAQWKHGDRPDQGLSVVAQGVPDTALPRWKGYLTESEMRGVTHYLYHPACRPSRGAARGPLEISGTAVILARDPNRLLKKPGEAFLGEMIVTRQDFRDALLMHHIHGDAIGETVVLVGTGLVESKLVGKRS